MCRPQSEIEFHVVEAVLSTAPGNPRRCGSDNLFPKPSEDKVYKQGSNVKRILKITFPLSLDPFEFFEYSDQPNHFDRLNYSPLPRLNSLL